ncbi:MAG: HD domain-containing protein [Bacilli bacterium]|jgi:uncharacterized protein|nr:HD domain-containing protein [Bacilli bacterium]
MRINIDDYFLAVALPILRDPEYQSMKGYVAHGDFSLYDHSLRVAIYAYSYAKNKLLDVDYDSLIRGSLLHDYYLYDWHTKDKSHRLHGFHHPLFALINASKKYHLNSKERNMIRSHMFPLTFWILPLSKEAWILTLADKACANQEHHQMVKKAHAQKKERRQLKKALAYS